MHRTRCWTVAALAAALLAPTLGSAQSHAKPKEKAMKDIVAVAADAGTFQTLLTAAKAAGLVETLRSAGPFTVFAPTDEAFKKLPAGMLEGLLKDRERLAAVLKYHVVPGRIAAAEILKAGRATPTTAQGSALSIRASDGKVYVDNARVVAADVQASNGVIHVIDAVVVPGASSARSAEVPAATSR